MKQNKLIQISQLLNNVETKGRQNMMNLLAALQLLDEVIQEANNGMDSSISLGGASGPVPNSGQANPIAQPGNN